MIGPIVAYEILTREDLYAHNAGRDDTIRALRHKQVDEPHHAWQIGQLIRRLETAVPDTRPMIYR